MSFEHLTLHPHTEIPRPYPCRMYWGLSVEQLGLRPVRLSKMSNCLQFPPLYPHANRLRGFQASPALHLVYRKSARYGGSAVPCKVWKNIFGAGGGPKLEGKSSSVVSPATVRIDTEAAENSTVVLITAQNRTGLFQIISRVFKAMGLQISKANVDAEEGSIVGKFLVTDAKGSKIRDPKSLNNIEKVLTDALNEPVKVADTNEPSRRVLPRPYPKDFDFQSSDQVKSRAELLFRLMDQYLKNDIVSIQKDILNHVEYTVARNRFSFDDFEAYQAMAHSVRDRLIESWNDTQQYFREKDPKRLYYLSLEFLMGRSLLNNIFNLGIKDQYAEALKQLGFDLEMLAEREGDAALGNGGLARLSACLMDSLATLDLPAWGYGLRYQYGLFRQVIIDGFQHEQPDYWLNFGNPWEIERIHINYPIKFYGKVEEEFVKNRRRKKWIPGEMVEAVAYDNPIPGYDTGNTINLRLWAAKPSGESDLESFTTGDYINAIINKQRAETISSVLYPDDRSYQGKELRLKQQYFFVSASLQDIMRRFKDFHKNFDEFPNKVALQLNDTHPSLAIAELMRMLVDEEDVEWNKAWEIVKKVFSFTNHTMVPESLEKIPVELLGSLLPRHLQIIYDINFYFMENLRVRFGTDYDRLARMSIIEEGAVKSVRMATLSVVGCHTVNGVSEFHSEILKTKVFKDFYDIWPHKFQNKTNGITQRRWLAVGNPGLRDVITKWIGTEAWIKDLDLLMGLREHANNPQLQREWRMVRRMNKSRLAEYIEAISGLKVSIDAMFDVQIKRIHEYKRQFLNILSIIHRYDCIKNMNREERRKVVPRVCLIGGKAAPGYEIAKSIIKLIHAVGEKINNDPDIGNLLKLVFVPDYNVSVAEMIIPASDLCQHISTAGHEASGTSNMKFTMNGCLILGTLDGSSIEIMEEIGEENMFIFGAKVHEVPTIRAERHLGPINPLLASQDGTFEGISGRKVIMAPYVTLRSALHRQIVSLTRQTVVAAEKLELQKSYAITSRWNSTGTSAEREKVESRGTAGTEPDNVKTQKEGSDSTGEEAQKERSKGHHMLAPFTAGWQSTDTHPLVIDKSEGIFVYDNNGKKYIDALAGLWNTALGGNEPRLVSAATSQLNKLPFYHSFWNRTTQPSLELAKEVLQIFEAKKMAKAFFTTSGSEANDTQVKLVWYYNNALGRPKKKKFIARQKAYHGSTLVSASLTGLPNLHHSFDLPLPFVVHTDCPHYWRYHLPGESEEEFATRLADNLERLILKEGPETIAAFIAEPLMGAGGVIPPPATYFEKVQAVVRKYDILFIADEVICAFGRLGTMFGSDKYNIQPDLVSIAKALSSAYMPIGAVLVSPEVADVILSESNKLGIFSHGFTYSGHPVSCAVALEALKIYKERNIAEHVRSISPLFQDGMRTLADSPIVGEIRGTGLIMGVDFTENKSPNDTFPADWAIGTYFAGQCAERGMLVRVSGDTIMMCPPLIVKPEEVQQVINIFGESLKSTEERVKYLKSQQNK